MNIVKQPFHLPTVQLAGFISSSFLPMKYHTQANQWARTVNMAISSVSTTKLQNKTTMVLHLDIQILYINCDKVSELG